jgi:hypothetical protein
MKVFFVSTPRGEGELRENYQLLYKEIAKMGFTHVSDFIPTTEADDFYSEMEKGRESHKKFYHTMVSSIQQADICVFEATMPSLGVGFLIQLSLDNSKPTLVFYHKENTPYFLSGIDDDKLIVKSYDNKNYKKVLKQALTIAREKRDKRFNFFLSPKLLNYLEDVSNQQGVTKSKILRDLIVEHMRSHAK